MTYLAQEIQLPGGAVIKGPLNLSGKPQFNTLSDVLSNALGIIFPAAGAILLAMLIWGGFDYITSFGDPKKAEMGKNKITSAIIGIVVIVLSYWIVQLIDYVFKLGIYTKVP